MMANSCGGKVASSAVKEYGNTEVVLDNKCSMFSGVSEKALYG